MDKRSEAVAQGVEEVLTQRAYKFTKFLSDDLTVKVTRKRYRGRPSEKSFDLIVTIGSPNFEEKRKMMFAKNVGRTFDWTAKYSKVKK